MGFFDNFTNSLKSAFSGDSVKRAFEPVSNAFNPATIDRTFTQPAKQALSPENIKDFGDRVATSTGNVGSVLHQVGNLGGKFLDNPIVAGALLSNPETAPLYLGAKAGTIGLQQVGNGLEQAGSLNGRDNSVRFV